MTSKQSYVYMRNVLEHKTLVGVYMRHATSELVRRAIEHDFSKFQPEEFGPYAAMAPRFAKAEYGSAEYIACCEAIKPAIAHHFKDNTHHPEHFPGGINDMDLLDVVEMVCDWIAACQRADGDTLRLDLQRARFNISDQLYSIICRTAERLAAHGRKIEIVQ